MKVVLFSVLFVFAFLPFAYSDDLDDAFSGFDSDVEEDEVSAEASPVLPEWMDLAGTGVLDASSNFAHNTPEPGETDYRGLSKLRLRLDLTGDFEWENWKARIAGYGFFDFSYEINGRDEYTDMVLDEYESEYEFSEMYFLGNLTRSLDIRLGRQFAVWGKSDNIRITDILNPLDNRTPGLTDIKDLRLPVAMTRLDYYVGDWNVSGIVIHETRFNKTPVFGSEYYPGKSQAPPDRDIPLTFKNQQYGLALSGIFSGWDLAFYGAWVFDSRAHLEQENGLELTHGRAAMGGVAGNVAIGNWLLKSEAAVWSHLEYAGLPDEHLTRLDALAAVEYSGFSETSISVEFANRHLFNFHDQLELAPDFAQKDVFQSVIRVTRDFAHDSIQANLVASFFGIKGDDGAFQRIQLGYDLTDDLIITGGVLLYQSGDLYSFSEIDDSDRVFFNIRYGF